MVRASSIYYAILLSILMAAVLGSMVMLSGINKQLEMKLQIPERLLENAQSGIAYAEVFHNELMYEKPLCMSLFGDVMDSVTVVKSNWGAFTILKSRAHFKGQLFSKISMGGYGDDPTAPNLYMIDNGRSLAIAGDTRLEGNCYLPSGGTKRAYIAGKNYSGRETVYGKQYQSDRNLPVLNASIFSYLTTPNGVPGSWSDLSDSIVHSFQEQPLIITDELILSTEGRFIKGAVWIEAKDSVFVSANSHIDGAIIKSPVVYIESGFTGNIQVFADRRIVVEEDVQLTYPSVLGVVEEQKPITESVEIFIGEESKVLGTVFMLSKDPNFRMLPELTIETDAIVHGLTYCQGKTQLKGTVNGSLYTQKFFLKTPASSYENHILDGQVLDQLPTDFVYADLLNDGGKSAAPLKRIDWLE